MDKNINLLREGMGLEQSLARYRLLLFTALKTLARSRIRGGDRLFSLAERLCLLSGNIRYLVDEHHPLYVPITRRWDMRDILEYESDLLSIIALKAQFMHDEITLVDCGADTGLVSVMLLSRIERITEVVAFEPNQDIYPLLQKTLSEQPCRSTALQMGVSNFSGYGELRSPAYDPEETGRYLVPVEHDGFPVVTIDDVLRERPSYCIIKIDVEGGEMSVLEGARTCIASAKGIIIALEAHPRVAARTGVDPHRILNFLVTLRPFECTVAEKPNQRLDLTRPFFDQFEPDMVYNIVCSSGPV